ncbi:ABC transporter substrate-binding protein [Streptomyces sp. NPDC058417]|uniref:ABC transporter substrate-binding protein n=1 Tax=unclassified Streptomyces TaxID=2593676 RepID=UPI003654F24D
MSDQILATDPASGYDPGSWLLFNNVFQSLLSFPRGAVEPEPDAAERCAFTGRTTTVYRCTLREGLTFSNGDALTATDVKFSFDRMKRIADPDGPSVMFPMLAEVSAPDPRTVVFRLDRPDATFPSKIASGAGSIVNHRQYRADGIREDDEVSGSGPYRLDSITDREAVFLPNENYRGAAEPENSGITLKLFRGDQDRLKAAVQNGEVDIAYRGLAAQDIADLEASTAEDVSVVEGSSAEVQHLVFNMDDPVTRRIGVRRAVALLLDREALIRDVYQDTATPLYSMVPAGIAGHATTFFDTYGARPSREDAAEALKAEGIKGKVELTLWSTPARYGPATDQAMAAIADQLNASGLFDAETRSTDFAQYEKDIAAGRYGVYVKGWVPDYPDAENFTAPFFGPDNVLNNRYVNRAITEDLLPRSATVADRPSADRYFGRLQQIVADEIPVLPIWQGKQYAVVRDGVNGVENCLDTTTVFRFWELSTD